MSRNVVIGSAVVLLHVAVLWAMNSGLVRRVAEVVVPIELVSEVITQPVPQVAPAPPPPMQAAPPPVPEPPPKPAAKPAPKPVAKPQPRTPPPAPRPVAAPAPEPAPPAAAVAQPQPAPPVSAPVAAAPAPAPAPVAPPAPPAPPRIELPSTSADYLQNPQPPYPPTSKRLGEQGQVMLRVLIGADGLPQEVELRRSSGYERLDRTAVDTVRRWRFVPGKRNGVPEAMWFNVPINFVLE